MRTTETVNGRGKNVIKLGTTTQGDPLKIDLDKLITSRLLVQAASGGGKSYLLRRLAEITGGKVQIIILDPEGEFATLRPYLDMVLVSDEGDIKPDPKNAAMLAKRLMELKVSAVCDLYELKKPDRRIFVSRFLDALMSLPKKLWRPTLIMLDEAHDYCPERGKGEATSTEAVIRLMSQGRKRGYCGVLATQRLSKLNKDAASECGTIFVGRTSPVDQKRAADEMGIKHTNPSVFTRLKDGEFLGYGPAVVSADVARFTVSKVVTEHPEAGKSHKHVAPAPSAAIKKVTRELTDLARSPDQPLTLEEATGTIAKLNREIKKMQRATPQSDATGGPEVINKAINRALDKQKRSIEKEIKQSQQKLHDVIKAKTLQLKLIAKIVSKNGVVLPEPLTIKWPVATRIDQPVYRSSPQKHDDDAPKLRGGALRMVQILADRHPAKFSLREWATLSNMSHKSGSFGTYKSTLNREGLFETDGRLFWSSDRAVDEYGDPTRAPATPEELLEDWKRKIGGGGVSRMLDVLVSKYPSGLSRDDLGEAADLSPRSGSFGTYLSKLRSNNLICTNATDGKFYAAQILVEAV